MKPDMEAKGLAHPVPLACAPEQKPVLWWSLLVDDAHCVLDRDPAARNRLEA